MLPRRPDGRFVRDIKKYLYQKYKKKELNYGYYVLFPNCLNLTYIFKKWMISTSLGYLETY